MCGVFFGVLGVGWGGRGLVFPIAGTMTWGYYKWFVISFLCTRVLHNNLVINLRLLPTTGLILTSYHLKHLSKH